MRQLRGVNVCGSCVTTVARTAQVPRSGVERFERAFEARPGLDAAIRDTLGHGVQRAVQARILADYHGELPVGTAVLVETGHTSWPFLIAAPTMRVPESVAQTVNAYLAFRAVLLAVRAHNASDHETKIRSVLCPGLGTGIGALDPTRCAVQMRLAYQQVRAPARIPSFSQIHSVHRALRTS